MLQHFFHFCYMNHYRCKHTNNKNLLIVLIIGKDRREREKGKERKREEGRKRKRGKVKTCTIAVSSKKRNKYVRHIRSRIFVSGLCLIDRLLTRSIGALFARKFVYLFFSQKRFDEGIC